MRKISKETKVLVIPDIHQNIGGFADLVLEAERDWEIVIFNGDYFDTFRTPDGAIIYGVGATCEWIRERFEEFGDRAIWHVGNHDVAYLASYNKNYINTKSNSDYFCSGWSKSKAKTFNKDIDPKWVESLKLCTQIGDDIVVSHAGFHTSHFKPFMSELDNIQRLSDDWDKTKHHFMFEAGHWIWDVGACRMGLSDVGSPVWLDWNYEFVPLDEVRQVVGHTTINSKIKREKKNGIGLKNYCIDCMQMSYAIIQNGVITQHFLSHDTQFQ
jgi:hypothetical protein